MLARVRQLDLYGAAAPSLDVEFAGARRTQIADGAWIEHVPGWVRGHVVLFERLRDRVAWRSERRIMYEREVDTPRLIASCDDPAAIDPLLERARRLLEARYSVALERVSFALYRDGHDSVAEHGDTTARDLSEALVATVSLGQARRLLLRPTGGGASRAVSLGGGDLFVMGGSCQRTWRHGIPKVARPVGPRIAVMFRPVW